MDKAEEDVAVEVKIHLEATVKVWSETALFFMAAAATMDPRISGVSLETRLEEMSDGRWTPLLELVSAERLVGGLPGVEYTGSTYIEWLTSDGFVSLEVGTTRFGFSFIANESSGVESYGRSGSLTQRETLAALIRKHS